MVAKRLFRSVLHRHAEPSQRVLGVAELPPDSEELAGLLASDPAPEVRAAAAGHCIDLPVLAAAWASEGDAMVRTALASALGRSIADAHDEEAASALIAAPDCTDAIRADVARRAQDPQRRRRAIAAVGDEAVLIALALDADHAETRMAAAERVRSPDGLRRIAEAAKNRDHGVARLARKRIDTLEARAGQAAEADAVLAQLEALAQKPGPILTAVIELNRRWEALNLGDDPGRVERCDTARRVLQDRFDREHEAQRSRAKFDRRLNDWLTIPEPPAEAAAFDGLRIELAALRDEARGYADDNASARLDDAERRIAAWELDRQALAGAEALVVEAEQLAAGTSIDHAKLPERWQALDRNMRTPALTRRFEAALIVVEQRRLAQIRAAEQEASAVKQQLHGMLHAAEQALAAGQLQVARAAADEIRARKSAAGPLPKPSVQRLSRLTQQLTELERWESFGQQQARTQLCERAEAAAALTLDAAHLAIEVQKLRNDWKALDQQHAGVPKALWERFDRACEKAYAPAARYFAEQAALRKQARARRDEFITAAAAHAPTMLGEPRDWRAIERWLRETDHRWHDGDLGSVEPKTWKGFDARLKSALGPLRDALATARDEAKLRRVALIGEATALAAKAMERGTPAQVKAIQARWQAQAKELALAQRDERVLWEQFRTACDAVFQAREAKRKQDDDVKHQGRRALEDLCAQLEQLATAADRDETDLRRGLRDLQERWRQAFRGSDPALRGIESRYRNAKTALEATLAARGRAREAAVWQTLAAKELLCEALDTRVSAGDPSAEATVAADEQWKALPTLPAAWEKAMQGRRDAALEALANSASAAAYVARFQRDANARREMLLELEMVLGLESPAELSAQRLALQVKQLRERFQSAESSRAATPADRTVAWCARPGIVNPGDRQRCERIFTALERAR